jgi:hypothetical protein
MELAAKFKMVSDSKKIAEIARPIEVEFEKPYPIIGAYRYMYLGSIPYVTLKFPATDFVTEEFRVGHIELSPANSRVIDDDDNTEINANPVKYK